MDLDDPHIFLLRKGHDDVQLLSCGREGKLDKNAVSSLLES